MRRSFEVFPDKNLSDFNFSADCLIERFQFFCGNPEFVMVFRPYILGRVLLTTSSCTLNLVTNPK